MGYVESTLAPGERVRTWARMHWLLWARALAVLVTLGIFVIGVIYFLAEGIRILNTEIALTDRRLIMKTGFFTRRTSELELASVETVQLNQSFWGRLFGFGQLSVHGTGEALWKSPMIAAPLAFRRDIEAALAASAPLPRQAEQLAS
jgi:uncharacterized membrane protein YdbT with pleckstrin-like domain